MSGPKDIGRSVSPVVRTVDLLGDRLTLAVLRDAFVDRVRRFGAWIDRTGAPPAVLSSRLRDLTEAGLMERPTDVAADRHDYLLTELGLATWELLVSVWAWQREWSPEGALQPEMWHVDCGHRGTPDVVCRTCGNAVRGRDARLVMVDGPAVIGVPGARRRSTRNSPSLPRADLQFTEVMEAIGDRWSAMVTGLALSGVRRFSDFQAILEISPTTLTERLNRLSDVGILTREEGSRDYVMTPRGRALFPIFAFLISWTRTAHPHLSPEELGPVLRHEGCDDWLVPGLRCRGCEALLTRTSVAFEASES